MTKERSLVEKLREPPGGIFTAHELCWQAADEIERLLERDSIIAFQHKEIERLEQQLDLKLFSRRQMEEDLAIIREWYGGESIDSLLRLKRRAVEPSTGGSSTSARAVAQGNPRLTPADQLSPLPSQSQDTAQVNNPLSGVGQPAGRPGR